MSIVLNEVYFGEQPELLEAVVHLGNFRKKYTNIKGRVKSKWNADPELDKFNTCIEKLFGFKSFYLNVYHNLIVDAHTVSCKYALGDLVNESKIYRTNKGYKYNGIISAVISASTELMFTNSFTDREVMAILLHEIGHCFSNKLTPIIDVTGKLCSIFYIPSVAIHLLQDPMHGAEELSGFSNKFREFYIKMNKNEFVGELLNSIDLVSNITKNTFYMIINSIPGIRFINLLSPTINIFMPVDFLDENIADNFATIYGFGPELVTALDKLDTNLTALKKIEYATPVIGWFAGVLDIASEFVIQLFDEHPTISSRRKAQYNYLLKEMDNADANPKLKKEIEIEISRMENAMNKIETDCGKFGGKLVRSKMNMLLDKLKRGDDIRSLIINNDTYGHIYNRPEYRNESTSIYESFLNVLSADII